MLPGTQVVIKCLRLKVLQKGDPSQGPWVSSCLKLESELSKETHRLTKQKTLKKKVLLYFWVCWVFAAMHRLSLVVASRGYSSLQCKAFSFQWPFLLWSMDPRHSGSVVVAHECNCSAACGVFPDHKWNPCPQRCQSDSYHLTIRKVSKQKTFLGIGKGCWVESSRLREHSRSFATWQFSNGISFWLVSGQSSFLAHIWSDSAQW